jgi:BlaI family transcriptional regulator, penicillinase repressor
MSEKTLRLGKVQYQIMQTLWQHGQATARQITDELAKSQPIAHSTVQTLLRQLEAKGVVAHDLEDRAFVFRPLYQQAQVTETPLRDLLHRVYQGSVVNLMSHLLKHEEVSPEERAQLRALIEEKEEQS